MPELLAVSVVHELHADAGMIGTTAIDKRPRSHAVKIGRYGARGDVQADRKNHGGLDAALTDLARVSPRQAAMVETRFFGGFDVAETAELLAVSEATVLRDWRAARAWLAHELRGAQ